MPIVATVAAATFVGAFLVADLSGVRPLGGLVLICGGAWCAIRLRRDAGPMRAAALLVFALLAFAASHPLGDLIGAWPAVAVVALAVGLATALAQRQARGHVGA